MKLVIHILLDGKQAQFREIYYWFLMSIYRGYKCGGGLPLPLEGPRSATVRRTGFDIIRFGKA